MNTNNTESLTKISPKSSKVEIDIEWQKIRNNMELNFIKPFIQRIEICQNNFESNTPRALSIGIRCIKIIREFIEELELEQHEISKTLSKYDKIYSDFEERLHMSDSKSVIEDNFFDNDKLLGRIVFYLDQAVLAEQTNVLFKSYAYESFSFASLYIHMLIKIFNVVDADTDKMYKKLLKVQINCQDGIIRTEPTTCV